MAAGVDTPFMPGGVYWESAAGPRGGPGSAGRTSRNDEGRTIGMSTENEGAGQGGEYGERQPGEYGAGPEEYGAEPTVQFDAFRARRADERAQQETQSGYVFPEEYAADPNAVFPQQPPLPPGPPYGGSPSPSTGAVCATRAGRNGSRRSRTSPRKRRSGAATRCTTRTSSPG